MIRILQIRIPQTNPLHSQIDFPNAGTRKAAAGIANAPGDIFHRRSGAASPVAFDVHLTRTRCASKNRVVNRLLALSDALS